MTTIGNIVWLEMEKNNETLSSLVLTVFCFVQSSKAAIRSRTPTLSTERKDKFGNLIIKARRLFLFCLSNTACLDISYSLWALLKLAGRNSECLDICIYPYDTVVFALKPIYWLPGTCPPQSALPEGQYTGFTGIIGTFVVFKT